MRNFVDTNVLADVLVQRQNPMFTRNASLLLSLADYDGEDAMQYSVACRNGCDIIVTRDRRGFIKSPVPFMAPDEFLSRLG